MMDILDRYIANTLFQPWKFILVLVSLLYKKNHLLPVKGKFIGLNYTNADENIKLIAFSYDCF